MRVFFILLVLSSFLVLGCNQETTTKTTQNSGKTSKQEINPILPGPFAHTVYFWLKEPTNEDDRAAFLTSLRNFINKSPNIVTQHIGVPADTERGVIDNSYTFSLLLTFKNAADEKAYQIEEGHLKFIEESKDLWSKVVVYDSELIK